MMSVDDISITNFFLWKDQRDITEHQQLDTRMMN